MFLMVAFIIRLVPYWNVNVYEIRKLTGNLKIRLLPYWNVIYEKDGQARQKV